MAEDGPIIEVPHDDPERAYTDDEKRELTLRLVTIQRRVNAALIERPPSVPVLEQLHRELFIGIRGHAGRTRSPSFGSERLTFGPHRSARNTDVPSALGKAFLGFEEARRGLLGVPEGAERALLALTAALRLHAEIIRVHPFEDGNGRTSRLLCDHALVQFGYRPVPLEVPKQEYLDVLNHYFQTQSISELVDLALRLAAEDPGA